jgi:hypothetical protein
VDAREPRRLCSVLCGCSAGMASVRRHAGGRNGRYLTVSVLHLVTIMCQGTVNSVTAGFPSATELIGVFKRSLYFML